MKEKKGNKQTVAFQGSLGSYSHQAATATFPKASPLPLNSFEKVFSAVRKGKADYALIPIDNSIAGRVIDVHRLIPGSGIFIVREYFSRIEHCLLGIKNAKLKNIEEIHSHPHALGQCQKFIQKNHLTPVTHADTAGAAEDISLWKDEKKAAIASQLAAKIYGLSILARNIEDEDHNTTRFLIISKNPSRKKESGPLITSIVFQVRNIPAALYKAIGGFATNGVNLLKLESYMLNGHFAITQFYIEVEGSPKDKALKNALEELSFYSSHVEVLGVYPSSRNNKK